MNVPIPGKPVRGSRSGKPIMALFDLLGRHWSMNILWCLKESPKSFNELEQSCDGISPTTLTTRLKELQKTFIIEKIVDGYALTKIGNELFDLFDPLKAWTEKWQKKFK